MICARLSARPLVLFGFGLFCLLLGITNDTTVPWKRAISLQLALDAVNSVRQSES